jgi:hypothetical protein
VWVNGSLAYRHWVTVMTMAMRFSGSPRIGNGAPVYLCEMRSMIAMSGSSTTDATPRTWPSS